MMLRPLTKIKKNFLFRSCSHLYRDKWITDKPLSYSIIDEILSIPLSKRIDESASLKPQKLSPYYNNSRGIFIVVIVAMIAIMIYWLLLINK